MVETCIMEGVEFIKDDMWHVRLFSTREGSFAMTEENTIYQAQKPM